MKVKAAIALCLSVSFLLGCGNKGAESAKSNASTAEAKSIAFYVDNPSIAEETLKKCKDMEQNELSTMTPDQLVAWTGTAQGINCKNAGEAHHQAYQKRLREAAENFK